jgi:hypothetical protein
MKMKLNMTQAILTMATLATFALTPTLSFAQGDPQGKPTAKKDIQKSGTEVGKAGTSLARNVKHGRIVRGGKRFGQHIGLAGKSVGRGTKTAVKTAVKP